MPECLFLAGLTAQSMFASKAGAYFSEESLRCYTVGQVPGLTHKHQTKLENPAKDKLSSLLGSFTNCEDNKVSEL